MAKTGASSISSMMIELSGIKSTNYPTLHAYLQRMTVLRNKLESAALPISDAWITTWLVHGIKDQYNSLHEILKIQGTLTYLSLGDIQPYLFDKADEEETKLALAGPKMNPAPARSGYTNNNAGRGQEPPATTSTATTARPTIDHKPTITRGARSTTEAVTRTASCSTQRSRRRMKTAAPPTTRRPTTSQRQLRAPEPCSRDRDWEKATPAPSVSIANP